MRRMPVPNGNGSRLIQQNDIDVPGQLDRLAAIGNHIRSASARSDAGDADGGKKCTDRRRNEADQQGDQESECRCQF